MELIKDLENLRQRIKVEICKLLTEKYLSLNDGLLPIWGNDEEVIVESDKKTTITIDVFVSYTDIYIKERQTISKYKVTLDGYLYFVTEENKNDESDWEDISTDELFIIYSSLSNN